MVYIAIDDDQADPFQKQVHLMISLHFIDDFKKMQVLFKGNNFFQAIFLQ